MPRYKDQSGTTFDDIPSIKEARLKSATKQEVQKNECPAADTEFLISHDQGESWRNPNGLTKSSLELAILETGQCCLHLGDKCPLRLRE